MKIATWNLERLARNKNQLILDEIAEIDADIFILTETSSLISLPGYHCVSTSSLPTGFDGIKYKVGENRTSIWTKYQALQIHKTFDNFTTACADVATPFGLLRVYGTIIGVFGGTNRSFKEDLAGNLKDFELLIPGQHACIIGDFNVMFSGRAYPSRRGKEILNDCFEKFDLQNTTESIDNNVDHIVISKFFLQERRYSIFSWNEDKSLSDHMGHCLTIN